MPTRAGLAGAAPAEEPRIRRYKTLGKTGLRISDIGAGGMSDPKVVRYCFDRGVRYFDTDQMFGTEPIVGVTPAANIFRELARPVDKRIWRALGTLPTARKSSKRRGPNTRTFAGLPAYRGERTRDASPADSTDPT